MAAVAAKRRTSGQQHGGTATVCLGVVAVLGRNLRDEGHEVSLPEVAVPAVCAIFNVFFGPAQRYDVVY